MATKPKRVYKRRKPAAARRRRAGPSRSLNPSYQVATVVETLDPNISYIQNTPYFQNVQLSQFQRCVAMATLYEQFRIEEVKYVYTPLYNTFQEASAGPATPTVPYVYTLMDRLQSLNPSTSVLADYVLAGARRLKFDKPITIKYRPNTVVTTGAQTAGVTVLPANQQLLQINGADYGRWFPCVTQRVGSPGDDTPNTLSAHNQEYNGHHIYFRQDSGVALLAIATVAITVRVSYKNPMVNNVSALNVTPWLPTPGRTIHTERVPVMGIE